MSVCLSQRMPTASNLLPIQECVNFNVACLVRQSLSGQVPLYLANDCHLVSDSTWRCLLSADIATCMVPQTLSSYGDRTFAAVGPCLWNSLPVQLRNSDVTCGPFRRQLDEKHDTLTSDMRCHRKTLTDLLFSSRRY